MNADRLVVRLAAVAALSNFGQAPYPTLAGNHVYDSRIEPVEDWKEDVLFPVCVVYTDYDKDHWNHHTSNLEERLLTVTFELLIAQITELPEAEGGGFMIAQPNTDSELETSLDIFEIQISNALRANNVASECWRHLMHSYINVISRRGATVEGGTKLAARQITVESRTPRGPTNGAIAPTIASFLNELEKHDDYQDRVPAIRQLYQEPASMSGAEQMIRAMGWTNESAEKLGYIRPLVVLGQPVVVTGPDGEPLP